MNKTNLCRVIFTLLLSTFSSALQINDLYGQEPSPFKTIQFEAPDGVTITGDVYAAHDDASAPTIVLCHQAGWSRGEYREIAPKLNQLGFNCLAIDQRSGGRVNDVLNETVIAAQKKDKPTDFVNAEQDMIAAIEYARQEMTDGKVILWGSSYSAALALHIAGEQPDLVDGVMAFAPGEYFVRFDKPNDWIASSAAKITQPSFITSAKNERAKWKAIHAAIPGDSKQMFVPKTQGNHGSRALWEKFDDHDAYWTEVKAFLKPYTNL